MPLYLRGKSVYDSHPAWTEFGVDADEDGEVDDGQPFWLVKEDDCITIGVKGGAYVKVKTDGFVEIRLPGGKKLKVVEEGGSETTLPSETEPPSKEEAMTYALIF